MKVYKAKSYTSIYPFGIIAKGEILEKKHLDKLGEEAIADMLRRGVIAVVGDEPDAAPAIPGEENAQELPPTDGAEEPPKDEAEAVEDEAAEDEEAEEQEEIDTDDLDEVLNDQPEESPAEESGLAEESSPAEPPQPTQAAKKNQPRKAETAKKGSAKEGKGK